MANDINSLIADVRQLSALKANKFFTDENIAVMISDAAKELYDLVVAEYEHYFKRDYDFTLTGYPGNTTLLPVDFYKEILLELNPLTPFPVTVSNVTNFAHKNRGSAQLLVNGLAPRQFLINGDVLEIIPAQNSAGDYRLIYVPQLEDLVLPNFVSLVYVPPAGDVNVTARLASTAPLALAGATWIIGTNLATYHVPDTTPAPVEFDGVQPSIGDSILVQKGDGFNGDQNNMGVWVFGGVGATAAELQYSFVRREGFLHGNVLPTGTRVRVTDGLTYAGSILSSQATWTVDTNSVFFNQAKDSTLTVDLVTAAPLELTGATWSVGPSTAQLHVSTPGPDGLTIDGVPPVVGNLTYWTPEDAPASAANAGPWLYTGISGTGVHLNYNFIRPAGMEYGDTLPFGLTVAVRGGETQRGAFYALSKQTTLGTSTDGFLTPVDYMDINGNIHLTNAAFDPTYVGGSLVVSNSPLGGRSYSIASVTNEHHAVLAALTDPLIAETFGAPTQIEVTLAGTRSTLPVALQPWHLFIKTHAAIAVRQGRNQDTAQLEKKLETERLRVAEMASNRQEDVTQAPITRGRRGGWYGWGR